MGYLDEVTRRRIAAVLLVVGVIVAALAIADVGPFDDPPTPEERAEDAVEAFFAAGAAGNFQEFCRMLTGPAREQVRVRAGALAAEQGLTDCDEILKAFVGDQLRGSKINVTEVSVSGPSARVETYFRLKGQKGRQQRTILLEQRNDRWLISDPGFG